MTNEDTSLPRPFAFLPFPLLHLFLFVSPGEGKKKQQRKSRQKRTNSFLIMTQVPREQQRQQLRQAGLNNLGSVQPPRPGAKPGSSELLEAFERRKGLVQLLKKNNVRKMITRLASTPSYQSLIFVNTQTNRSPSRYQRMA